MPHHADDRAIEDEAVRAEIDRLIGLDLAELAVEIMAAFGMDRGRLVGSQGRTEQEVAAWLLRDYPTGGAFLPLLRSAVRRASMFLVQVAAAEYGDAGFGVAADGEVTSVTGLLQPTRWGANLLADGRLGKYVRACWAREHAVSADPPPDQPGAEQRADWAQPPAGWTQPPAGWTQPPAAWTQPQAGWTQPAADWSQPSASWSQPAAGWAQPQPDWMPSAEPEADWLPPLDWPSDSTDWAAASQPPSYLAPATDWPGQAADWPAPPPAWPAGSAADWAPPVPYLPLDPDRLIVERILPSATGEPSPGPPAG